MRDLHDSFGAKLLSMLQRSRGQPSADGGCVDIQPQWLVRKCKAEPKLSFEQTLLLHSFLREDISNALKHAQPKNIFVRIEPFARTIDADWWKVGDIPATNR